MSLRLAIAEMANAAAPAEACGFIVRSLLPNETSFIVIVQNIDDAPYYRFTMDPDEAEIWWGTGRVQAVWHSHPTGSAVPSGGDEEQAVPGVEHWIYSVEDEDLTRYRLEDGKLVLIEMESPA